MNVGIITFQYNNNYGAVLQCYALTKAILALDHEPTIIDYIPPHGERKPFWRGWNIRRGQFIQTARSRFLQLRYERNVHLRFEKFRNQFLPRTAQCIDPLQIEQIAQTFDALICGSDQVWVFERPAPYFLSVGKHYHGKKISYAACCGHNRQPENLYPAVQEKIADIDCISVRNEFTKKIIAPMTEHPIFIAADPTLLVDFDGIRQKNRIPFSDYILVYTLGRDTANHQKKTLSLIQQYTGKLPIVAVVANSCPRLTPNADLHIFDASPQEWIDLIAGASFVYTDSFHGSLFSIKHNTPFLADYKEAWRALRLLDAAERYNFENHLAHNLADAEAKLASLDNDYSEIHRKIKDHASASYQFLREALIP